MDFKKNYIAPISSSLFSGRLSGTSITKFILSSLAGFWFWSSISDGRSKIVGVENVKSALTIKFCFFTDGGGVGFTDGDGVGFADGGGVSFADGGGVGFADGGSNDDELILTLLVKSSGLLKFVPS